MEPALTSRAKSSKLRSDRTNRPITSSAIACLARCSFYAGQNRAALASLKKGIRIPRSEPAASRSAIGSDGTQALPSSATRCWCALSLGLLDQCGETSARRRAPNSEDHAHPPTIATSTFCGRHLAQGGVERSGGTGTRQRQTRGLLREKKVEQIRLLAEPALRLCSRSARADQRATSQFIRDALEAVRGGSNAE